MNFKIISPEEVVTALLNGTTVIELFVYGENDILNASKMNLKTFKEVLSSIEDYDDHTCFVCIEKKGDKE